MASIFEDIARIQIQEGVDEEESYPETDLVRRACARANK